MHPCLRVSSFTLMALACLGGGCRYAPVNTPDFSHDPSIKRIDPNNGPFVQQLVQERDPETGQIETLHKIQWKPTRITPDLRESRTVAVKTNAFDFWMSGHVQIPVRIRNGREYSAVMDTGCGFYLHISDAVVRDNHLAVHPLGVNTRTGCAQGLCEIPRLDIGDIAIENLPAWYVQRQWQLRILGLPVYRRRTVLIGLELMRSFSYILFDNPEREVVFSPHDAFEPHDPAEWVTVPFTWEGTQGGLDLRMMVEISLAGVPTRLSFDTGGGKAGLILSEEAWQAAADRLGARGGHKGKIQTHQHGRLPCRRFVVPELPVGDLLLHDKEVFVLPSASPFVPKGSGILGLAYFKQTCIVLDFRNSRLWIRKV
jgi:hypothetical protein